jgi:hypothetical protein
MFKSRKPAWWGRGCAPIPAEQDKQRLTQILHDRRNALPATYTHRSHAVVRISPPEFIEQCERKPRTRRAKWMPDGDGTAIDIQLVKINCEFTGNCQGLGSKCLVYLVRSMS